MNRNQFKSENMRNIKNRFLCKIQNDIEYKADVPQTRTIRKSAIAAIAAVFIMLSTAIFAVAVGFNPILVWQSLFERESAIEVGTEVISAGISMGVQALYTDGNQAIIKMTLLDLEGGRLSEGITLEAYDVSKYRMHIVDSFYDAETGKVTCIVFINFLDEVLADDTFIFTINSIIVGLDNHPYDVYLPFDFDLYGAAAEGALLPVMSGEEWAASARANPVRAVGDPEYAVRRGGVAYNLETNEFATAYWLPLDTSAQGEELAHWLSVLGVGYSDGFLNVQLRYNDLFGFNWQYVWEPPALIDNEGTIIKAYDYERDGWSFSGEILYCGYQELRFYVGDIENLRNLRLAWTGNYAEYVIDGNWSVDINLTAIGGSISGSAELPGHPEFTSVSYKLSPMYLETVIDFPDWGLQYTRSLTLDDDTEVTLHGFDEQRINEQVNEKELAIVLADGTKIEPEHDRLNFSYGIDASTGGTRITSWHVLDGSFEIEDVAEVIIFGVSFVPGASK